MATGCDRVRLIWLCENTQRLCAARYIHVQHYLWVQGRPSERYFRNQNHTAEDRHGIPVCPGRGGAVLPALFRSDPCSLLEIGPAETDRVCGGTGKALA